MPRILRIRLQALVLHQSAGVLDPLRFRQQVLQLGAPGWKSPMVQKRHPKIAGSRMVIPQKNASM